MNRIPYLILVIIVSVALGSAFAQSLYPNMLGGCPPGDCGLGGGGNGGGTPFVSGRAMLLNNKQFLLLLNNGYKMLLQGVTGDMKLNNGTGFLTLNNGGLMCYNAEQHCN